MLAKGVLSPISEAASWLVRLGLSLVQRTETLLKTT